MTDPSPHWTIERLPHTGAVCILLDGTRMLFTAPGAGDTIDERTAFAAQVAEALERGMPAPDAGIEAVLAACQDAAQTLGGEFSLTVDINQDGPIWFYVHWMTFGDHRIPGRSERIGSGTNYAAATRAVTGFVAGWQDSKAAGIKAADKAAEANLRAAAADARARGLDPAAILEKVK